MIVLAIILAAAVLELGLVSFAFRQGRVAGERERCRLCGLPLDECPRGGRLVRGGVHVVPGMPMPASGDPSPRVPPAPVRPSPMRPEKW